MTDIQYVDGWWIPASIVEGKHPILRRKKGSCIIGRSLRYFSKSRRGLCIQAGGHLGLWPKKLADHFDHVITLEVQEENYACLRRNVQETNVSIRFAALGDDGSRTVSIKHGPSTGSHYIKSGSDSGSVPMTTIDSIQSEFRRPVDAIFLDIEGYEIPALQGAMETLRRDRPMVVCEENTCMLRYGHEYGDILKLLEPLGYREVHRYKKDIVFIHEP